MEWKNHFSTLKMFLLPLLLLLLLMIKNEGKSENGKSGKKFPSQNLLLACTEMEIKIVWRRNCKHEHEAVWKEGKKKRENFHLDGAGWSERWAMVESMKEKAASGFTLAAHSCAVCVCARENNEKNEKKRWKFFVSVEGFFLCSC